MTKQKFRIRVIDGIVYVSQDGVFIPLNEKKSSRLNSWITLGQITHEFPEFYDKIEDIFTKRYNDKARGFATNIMNFLEMDGFLSWKQFDCIWRICETYDDYMAGKDKGFYRYGSILNVKSNNVSFTIRGGEGEDFLEYYLDNKTPHKFFEHNLTDKEMDNWHRNIFGCSPMFYEEAEEGYTVDYDREGNRVFLLPTEDDNFIF